MPDNINEQGVQLKTRTEIRDELIAAAKRIYGIDLSEDPSTPDMQLLNIIAQQGADAREILAGVAASFDPYQATGRFLDQRVALSGIVRLGGTFSTVLVDVSADAPVNIVGLDDARNNIEPSVPGLFAASDSSGNLFYPLDSFEIVTPGTTRRLFRAAELGAVQVSANSITVISTPIAGVTGVGNASGAVNLGRDEESDIQLLLRWTRSRSIGSLGMAESIQAAIESLGEVVSVTVLENHTTATDANGIPAHSIWAIVDGGDNEEIAQVIKSIRNGGCGMRGETEVNIPYRDGRDFIVRFDRPILQDLYIRFSIADARGRDIILDEVKNEVLENIRYAPGEDVSASGITAFVQNLDPEYVITNMGVGVNNQDYTETLEPTAINYRFVLSGDRIAITDG